VKRNDAVRRAGAKPSQFLSKWGVQIQSVWRTRLQPWL